MTFPAKRDPLQRDPRSFEKSSRPPHPQSKLLTLPPPSRVPSQTKSSHGYTVGIKISSATSLFSQLRNPSRKRANSTNNRAFSRPPRQRQESKRSVSLLLQLLLSNERCFSLPFLFFDLFRAVSLSYVSSNAMHRTNPRLDRFGCIVITTVTRYNEEDTRLTRRVTTRRLLARGVFRSLAERSRANLLSRRNNETFSSLGTLNDFREKSWITRAGIVGEAVDRNRFRGNRMIAARSRSNRRTVRIKRSSSWNTRISRFLVSLDRICENKMCYTLLFRR